MSKQVDDTAKGGVHFEPLGEVLRVSIEELDAARDDIDSGEFGGELITLARTVRAQLGSERSDHEPALGLSLVALATVVAYRLAPYEGKKVSCAPLYLILGNGEETLRAAHISVVRLPCVDHLRFRIIAFAQISERSIERSRWEFKVGGGEVVAAELVS